MRRRPQRARRRAIVCEKNVRLKKGIDVQKKTSSNRTGIPRSEFRIMHAVRSASRMPAMSTGAYMPRCPRRAYDGAERSARSGLYWLYSEPSTRLPKCAGSGLRAEIMSESVIKSDPG